MITAKTNKIILVNIAILLIIVFNTMFFHQVIKIDSFVYHDRNTCGSFFYRSLNYPGYYLSFKIG